jgi:queuosine precursor transporter
MFKNNLLLVLVSVYITVQICCDILAPKIIEILGLQVSITVIFFPLTYILCDILTEVFDFKTAQRVIRLILLSSILASAIFSMSLYLTGTNYVQNNAFELVLQNSWRVAIAGWIAVYTGATTNNFIMQKYKSKKTLFFRAVLSTIVGELVNTALFYILALSFILPNSVVLNSILAGWVIKVCVEIVMYPFTHLIIGKLKAHTSSDKA